MSDIEPSGQPAQLEQERAERFEVIDRMQDACKDIPAEEIDREADRAVATIRAEAADHAEEDARIARNMNWMHEFLQSILADPAILNDIPDGASVYLLPDDDPELAEANLRGAERSRQRGHAVYVRRMPSRNLAKNGAEPRRGRACRKASAAGDRARRRMATSRPCPSPKEHSSEPHRALLNLGRALYCFDCLRKRF